MTGSPRRPGGKQYRPQGRNRANFLLSTTDRAVSRKKHSGGYPWSYEKPKEIRLRCKDASYLQHDWFWNVLELCRLFPTAIGAEQD